MWSTPFLDGDVVVVTISFPVIVCIAALRVWNYNCTADLTYCGVSSLLILTYYIQWRTEGGAVWGVQTPPPEIPKALQNCAKLNPICQNC